MTCRINCSFDETFLEDALKQAQIELANKGPKNDEYLRAQTMPLFTPKAIIFRGPSKLVAGDSKSSVQLLFYAKAKFFNSTKHPLLYRLTDEGGLFTFKPNGKKIDPGSYWTVQINSLASEYKKLGGRHALTGQEITVEVAIMTNPNDEYAIEHTFDETNEKVIKWKVPCTFVLKNRKKDKPTPTSTRQKNGMNHSIANTTRQNSSSRCQIQGAAGNQGRTAMKVNNRRPQQRIELPMQDLVNVDFFKWILIGLFICLLYLILS